MPAPVAGSDEWWFVRLAKALADGGARYWREEANESAEQALSAIARSRRVLDRWPDHGRESRELVGVLDAIADGLRAEFPSVGRRPRSPATPTTAP